MKSSLSFAKVWFVISFGVLAFLYGTAVGKWEWFPHSFLDRATDQARSVFNSYIGGGDGDGDGKLTTRRVYDRSGVQIERPGRMQPGMTLLVSSWNWDGDGSEELSPGAKLIDREGQTVHSWHPDRSKLFPSPIALRGGDPTESAIHGSYLLPNGDLILIMQFVGAVRIDACGDVVWRLEESNHHSVAQAEDGTFWIPGVSSKRKTETPKYPDGVPYPSSLRGSDKSVWIDRLLHVSADGEVLDDMNLLDVLYTNGLERYILKAQRRGAYMSGDGDPLHLNDVEPLSPSMADEYPRFEAGDLLVSLKHPDLVLVLDPDSKTVKWHADSTPSDSHHLLQHHDPDFMGSGWIGVFNNREDFTDRGALLGGSQILAFQPHTDSTRVLFPTQNSDSIYTQNRGKWQYLENGNLLLTESNAGRALEVTSDGKTVWEWIHAPSSDSEVPFVTKASRHGLTREEVASWSCSSVDSVSTSARKQ